MLKEGTNVLVHSLGEKTPGEYRGIIRGVGDTYPLGCIYLVEMIDRIRSEESYPYSVVSVPSGCVKETSNV